MPKSSTFTKSVSSPRRTSITFSGLRSRWTMPCACASPAASQSCSATWSARARRQRAARRRERALERQPVEVLHHDVDRAVGQLPGEVHLHDVRVLSRRDATFASRWKREHELLRSRRARGGGSSPRRRGRSLSGTRGRRAPSRRRRRAGGSRCAPRSRGRGTDRARRLAALLHQAARSRAVTRRSGRTARPSRSARRTSGRSSRTASPPILTRFSPRRAW